MNGEAFPKLLRWALLGPFAVFALMYVIALAARSQTTGGLWLLSAGMAALVELVAIPTAIFLLLRDGRYATWGNIAMTLAAAIPVALIVAIALILKYGHFHI